MKTNTSKPSRLTLELPEKTKARLENLKVKTEATSSAEVIKSALRLYEAVISEVEAGNSFMVREPSGQMKEYVIF